MAVKEASPSAGSVPANGSRRSGHHQSDALGSEWKLALAKLATSCLDETDANALGMKIAVPAELFKLGLPSSVPALEIPYFDMNGKKDGYCRWRYLVDSRTSFDKLAGNKERRYVQAPNTPCRLYFPPLADASWKTMANDPAYEIAVTEGELKAACVTRHLMPCIGLGGVYSWRSAKAGIALIPDFDLIKWQGRDVVVIFDSDASKNPMVVAARNALCRVLMDLGAKPRIVELPATLEGGKQGADDFILAEGVGAMAALVDESDPWAMAAELHRLSEEVVYVRDPGLIVELSTGQRISAKDFVQHSYSNRRFMEQQILASGAAKLVEKSAARAWLDWPQRSELKHIVYEPGSDVITDKADYNIWRGWGCQPMEGDISPWKKLLDSLFEGFPLERQWFERWCALPLQQPGTKLYTAAVLWGVPTGTGKSSVGYALGKIYGTNFTEIGDKEIEDARNEWAEDKQFVLGDDVTGQEQRKHAKHLKAMITQHEMRIDRKYVPSFTVQDVINYLFTSNHPDAFFLEDDDRRFFVHEVRSRNFGMSSWTEFYKWLNGQGPSYLFYHLLCLDLGNFDRAERAPDTIARKAMIADGQSDLGEWVRQLREAPNAVLKVGNTLMEGDLWTSADLLAMYDPDSKKRVTANGLSREMKRAGIEQAYKGMPVKLPDGSQVRLFILRNSGKWSKGSSKDFSEHYAATRLMRPSAKKF